MMSLLTQNYITRGFWGDEAWTALITQQSVPDILRITGEDFHPPFYYLLIHFWGVAFGFSELSIRMVSLFFFLLIPIVAYFLTADLFKKVQPRLIISGLLLISPILFTYAFEARSYALLTFLSTATSLCFWRGRVEKTKKWRVAYLLLAVVAVYTHYYSWFILASHAVYALVWERKLVKKYWMVGVGVLLAQLPWIPVLFSQVGSVSNSYWIGAINERTHWEFFLRVAGGDIGSKTQQLTAIFIGLLVVFGIFQRTVRKKVTPFYLFILSWLIVPTLIPSLISLQVPVFFYRYLIFSIVPLLILMVDATQLFPKKIIKWAMPASIAVVAVLYLLLSWTRFKQYPNTMRQEAQEMYQIKQVGEGAVYTVLPSFAETMYYVGDIETVKVLPEGIIQFSGKSLLDAYVRNGQVEIVEAPSEPYWFMGPGPKAELVVPESASPSAQMEY